MAKSKNILLYKNLKNKIKKYPKIWKFLVLIKKYFIILSRLKDVLMMMVLFSIWPEKTYLFSTRKALPGKKNKFLKEQRSITPYNLVPDKSGNIPKMKEINIIGRGSSFDLNSLKKLNGPIFLVSFWNSLKIDSQENIFYKHYFSYDTGKFVDNRDTMNSKDLSDYFSMQENLKDYKNKNITYIISRPRVIELLKRSGHNVLSIKVHTMNKEGSYLSSESPDYLKLIDNDKCKRISVEEKIYRGPMPTNHPDWVPTGSLLPCVCALSFYAEKINIFGWDSHLDFTPNNMSYIRLLLNTYKYKTDVFRWKAQFEHALINFYYGYHFSKLPNINIYGYMGQLEKHKSLITRIEKVLFN